MVNKGEFHVYTVRIYMKLTHVCAAQTHQEIAELRPDTNIKVAAFTVSEKSINTELFQIRSEPG